MTLTAAEMAQRSNKVQRKKYGKAYSEEMSRRRMIREIGKTEPAKFRNPLNEKPMVVDGL